MLKFICHSYNISSFYSVALSYLGSVYHAQNICTIQKISQVIFKKSMDQIPSRVSVGLSARNSWYLSHLPTFAFIYPSKSSEALSQHDANSVNLQKEPSQGSLKSSLLSELMTLTKYQWKARDFCHVNALIEQYIQSRQQLGLANQTDTFLEKHDLDPGAEVAVIGDIHGNGLRLELTLKSLQQQGVLDDQYKCLPGKYVVFLGDYMDRGKNNLKVLELVIAFKLENREHVFLVRGNHEDVSMIKNQTQRYTRKDRHYSRYVSDANNCSLLDRFYKCLPAAVYLGQKSTDSDQRQYIQYCHGLFHLYIDPHPLLAEPNPNAYMSVNECASFSPRIQQMIPPATPENGPVTAFAAKQAIAKATLDTLKQQFEPKLKDIYWFDIGMKLGNLEKTRKTMPPEIVKAYLRVCSTKKIKVKEIIRGHQKGGIWFSGIKDKRNIVTTIDPSSRRNKKQQFMRIKLAQKIRQYIKTLITIPLKKDQNSALTMATEQLVAS